MNNSFPISVEDFRHFAKKRLPNFLFDYIDGGSNDERTMAANIADFEDYCLKQQVMSDVGSVNTSTELCGQTASMPLALAPVGMAGMMARRGEVQAAKAAKAAGVPFTCSTVGVCSVEEIKQASTSIPWFQLYMLRDRDVVLQILERAKLAGCNTLIFTVDLAVAGMRHRDYRNGMLAEGLKAKWSMFSQLATRPRWLMDVGCLGGPHAIGNLSDVVDNPNSMAAFKAFIDSQFDPSVTWKDITWLRSVWDGKLIIKGVLEVDDARQAVDAGADGVVVSNHGGRQLDGVASSISKLPAVVDALDKQIDVFMDGGVRSGIDVVKAVALGAKGVLIGRPWVWAMAARQEAGITALLTRFQQEIEVAMALMGVNRIAELNADLIDH
ncbi:L-lactate dehydrogenase [Maricurvus nonylphenolicus]|uniref:L-lactate dehydrogenase n=1 Tax=Maricurvus nonylphenolicus TaxID=1008307 RepID=UPI0036F33DBA